MIMSTSTSYPRINIYLDDPSLRAQIKIAPARHGVTISTYCVDAIRHQLSQEGLLTMSTAGVPESQAAATLAAQKLDKLRQQLGTIGVSVRDLIAEGRQR